MARRDVGSNRKLRVQRGEDGEDGVRVKPTGKAGTAIQFQKRELDSSPRFAAARAAGNLLLDLLQGGPGGILENRVWVETGMVGQQVLALVVDPGVAVQVAQLHGLAGRRIAECFHVALRDRKSVV